MRSRLVGIAMVVFRVLGEIAPPCDVDKKSGNDVCDDFCNYRCSFYNVTAGETGEHKNITLYRITPANVTGIKNKDTGDAPGDVGFFLSKKNLTQQCAKDPTSFGCFLDGSNIYGKFEVEIDSSFGPYFECNPVSYGITPSNPYPPTWVDTSVFLCGQGCMIPTETGCHGFHGNSKPKNGTSEYGPGFQCFCDTSGRHNKSVGREVMPYTQSWDLGPSYWQPQCKSSYYEPYDPITRKYGGCPLGEEHATVSAWSFASVSAMACDRCSTDDQCTGWRTTDNRTATLFKGKVRRDWRSKGCIGGVKWVDPHGGGGGGTWGSAGQVGGYWYSTPITAECKDGAPLGTDGCTWRLLAASYRNASCVDKLVDAAVEKHGNVCFEECGKPLDRLSDCYLDCYRNTLLGDAAYNITKMSDEQIVGPWKRGFANEGACPEVVPLPCHGPQC